VYSIFGLNIVSDVPLAGVPASDAQRADVVFAMAPSYEPFASTAASNESCWYRSEWIDETTGVPGLTIYRSEAGAFRILYSDGIEFLVDAEGRRIVGRAPSPASLADVTCYITGPVLGFVLRLRGVVALHASAIAIGGQAVLLVGDARSGKSTTAAFLARMGYKVITEDVAALAIVSGTLTVRPGCAEVALRPDAVASVFGTFDALPRFSDTWDKRRLDLVKMGAFATDSVPVGRVYLLTNTEGFPNAPCVAPLPARDAMVELLANIYGNRLFHHDLRIRELETVHHVVTSVPVKVAATGAQPHLIPRFCEILLDDLHCS
jgi:hypothetical protein